MKKSKRPASFDSLRVEQITADAESAVLAGSKQLPEVAKFKPTGPVFGAYFVPVSFVAKDWGVIPRRIRALLAAGRLAGQLQPNGYWEVRYPYLFVMGTRGPALKRQRPVEKPKKPELRAV